MHSWPDHSSETFTDLYEIDGCFVDEETYQAKWQELYEDQEYVLIGYEDGLLIKEGELDLLLSEAIDDLSVRRDMACFSYENRRKYEKDIYATALPLATLSVHAPCSLLHVSIRTGSVLIDKAFFFCYD